MDFSGGPAVKMLTSTARDTGLKPGQGAKTLHALWQKKKKKKNIKQKQYCNKFNKVFKNGPYKKKSLQRGQRGGEKEGKDEQGGGG